MLIFPDAAASIIELLGSFTEIIFVLFLGLINIQLSASLRFVSDEPQSTIATGSFMACVCAWIVFACNAVFNLVVMFGSVLRLVVEELVVVGVRIALEDLVIK